MNYATVLNEAIAAVGRHEDIPSSAGCYVIANTATGRVYVGRSLDMKRRISQHVGELRRGNHTCKLMQSDCQEHGLESFMFSVAIECDYSETYENEKRLITIAANSDTYNTNVFIRMRYVFLPEQMLERLKAMSAKTGASVSELIRRAIEAYLKANKQ